MNLVRLALEIIEDDKIFSTIEEKEMARNAMAGAIKWAGKQAEANREYYANIKRKSIISRFK